MLLDASRALFWTLATEHWRTVHQNNPPRAGAIPHAKLDTPLGLAQSTPTRLSLLILMPGFLFRLCFAHRCSFALFDDHCRLTQTQAAFAVSVVVTAARLRRRRVQRARAQAIHLHKRRRVLGLHSLLYNSSSNIHTDTLTLNLNLNPYELMDMALQQQAIRRRYSVADRLPADLVIPTTSNSFSETAPDSTISSTTTTAVAASVDPRYVPARTHTRHGSMSSVAGIPPPPQRDETISYRRGHTRAKSSVSSMNRQVNRLSLTLPIAPPTSDPSRPTPTSAMSSVPPTPIDSTVASPADANGFIIAIAAQERRVLELREELSRAEAELTSLKKRWTSQEKKGDSNPIEAYRSPVLPSDDDGSSVRRSAESDRRKLLQQTGATTPNRRRILRGGHTRTLSLLSPAKPDAGFSLYQDRDHEHEQVKLPSIERRTAQLTNPHLNKRASWQPRTQQNVPGAAQIVEDFKLGLRAFVEDIRQITVGDEPINGQPVRSNSVSDRSETSRAQDTIRPNRPLRPKVSTVFEPPHNNSETSDLSEAKVSTLTTASKTRPEMPPRSKTKSKNKSFSWQPLGFDSMDDNDWSNWESPASSSKTSRWSGSTIGSNGLDDMSVTSDEGEPEESPS